NWTHVAGVYQLQKGEVPGYLKVFVNGTLTGNLTTTITEVNNTNDLFIRDWSGNLNATFDNLKMYNRSFSNEQIKQLYEDSLLNQSTIVWQDTQAANYTCEITPIDYTASEGATNISNVLSIIDYCIYTSGDWNVALKDFCVITSSED
ncbi:unnamed protein product, partial [marine sediment metagenome]